MELPFIDEHCLNVGAGPHTTWATLLEVVPDLFTGRGKELFARTIGCEQIGQVGPRPLQPGSAFTGFRVASISPEKKLQLEGRHRFSRYALNFRTEQVADQITQLCAETRAEFPGTAGSFYRSLVIGTRIHVAVVRNLLRAIKLRAEQTEAGV